MSLRYDAHDEHIAAPPAQVVFRIRTLAIQLPCVERDQYGRRERIREDLDVVSRSLAAGCTVGGLGELRLDVMFDLFCLSFKFRLSGRYLLTLVTAVPARKKTANNVKNTLHGCIACTTAVTKAVKMPAGVSDFLEYARYTRAAIAGTAMTGFILRSSMGRRKGWNLCGTLRKTDDVAYCGPWRGLSPDQIQRMLKVSTWSCLLGAVA